MCRIRPFFNTILLKNYSISASSLLALERFAPAIGATYSSHWSKSLQPLEWLTPPVGAIV